MKNLIYKYIIFVFAISLFSSCNDDYLTEYNPNVISADNFWRNLSETNLGLNATYKTLHNPAVLNIIPEILRSDMGYPGYGRPVPQNTESFYNHTYNESSLDIQNKWETNYVGVFRANQVIEALNDIRPTLNEEDLEEWTSQMAQAKFLRGLFHYYLYTTFNNGSIIIRDFVPVSDEDFHQPLSSAEDVIAFIREDLEYAYANLYMKGEYPDNDRSRVTSGAAATILGQSYLNELNYELAMPYFEDVINNHGYELVYDMDLLFTTAGEHNEESIFEITFTEDYVLVDESQWVGDSGTNWLNQQTSNTRGPVGPAWIAHAYKNEPMDPLDSRNYFIDEWNNNALTQRSVPLRASAMIALPEDNQTIWYLDGVASQSPRFHATAWGFAWWKKYTNHDIVSREADLPNGAVFSGKNVTVNRLAEVMLMQAECNIKTGAIDEALDLINEIRKRWGLVLLGPSGGDSGSTYDDEIYTAETLMNRLMYVEKPLELAAEGHAIRFLDFQRWKQSDNYGFKDRLQELSDLTLYGINFQYVNPDNGNLVWKWQFTSLVEDPGTDNHRVVDYEYDLPFANYNESNHGYYPIPDSETSTNLNVN